jgi:hypothetical protein
VSFDPSPAIDPSGLSDAELADEMMRLARSERTTTARLIVHLAEFDGRRLYLGAGFRSLFAYCVEVLRLSEHEAYNRIEATRVARRFPAVLDLLGAGSLNLTTVRLLSPHLTDENGAELLAEAAGKGKRGVEELLARRFPKPDVQESIRKIPVRLATPTTDIGSRPEAAPADDGRASLDGRNCVPTSEPPVPVTMADPLLPPLPTSVATPTQRTRPDLVRPLAEDRYEIRFTASAQTCDKLRLAKDLLRHSVPRGDTAQIIDRALTALLEELARKKYAATPNPRASGDPATRNGSRYIPARVKRAVWARDGGRCQFVARGGRRCSERGFLEFHHVRPHAVGGAPTVENIELRCRAHNAYEADLYYGPGIRIEAGADVDRMVAAGQLVPERVGGSDQPNRELKGDDVERMEESVGGASV